MSRKSYRKAAVISLVGDFNHTESRSMCFHSSLDVVAVDLVRWVARLMLLSADNDAPCSGHSVSNDFGRRELPHFLHISRRLTVHRFERDIRRYRPVAKLKFPKSCSGQSGPRPEHLTINHCGK
ncbi:hypothetical protein QE152_g23498 [Popillia japonica]|uniref:Uncharacterized protein n=1 Tax=Popillia japonica TaxID=7064 RepID=A0AAW1KH17_POPJA